MPQVERIASAPTSLGVAPQEVAVPGTLVGANDNEARVGASVDRSWARYTSALPEDAVGVIEPFPIASNQGGRARKDEWRLRFLPRKKPFVDPLTGWTGGNDPLVHLSLRFPNREAAVRYCERLGLKYQTREPPSSFKRAPVGKQAFELQSIPPLCCWPTGPHALCCGAYPIQKQKEAYHGE